VCKGEAVGRWGGAVAEMMRQFASSSVFSVAWVIPRPHGSSHLTCDPIGYVGGLLAVVRVVGLLIGSDRPWSSGLRDPLL